MTEVVSLSLFLIVLGVFGYGLWQERYRLVAFAIGLYAVVALYPYVHRVFTQ